MAERQKTQLEKRAEVMLETLKNRNEDYKEQLRLSKQIFEDEGGNPYDYEMGRWNKRDVEIGRDRAPLLGAIQALGVLLNPELSKFEWRGQKVYFDFSESSTDSEQTGKI